MRSHWIWVDPNSITDVLIRGNFVHRDTKGECHVTMMTEIGVACLQVKGHQGCNNHQKLGESMKQIFPLSP